MHGRDEVNTRGKNVRKKFIVTIINCPENLNDKSIKFALQDELAIFPAVDEIYDICLNACPHGYTKAEILDGMCAEYCEAVAEIRERQARAG